MIGSVRQRLPGPFFAALLAIAAAEALAQGAWPARPIRQLVGNSTGSGPDITSRILGEYMTRSLGQPWTVENRPGADGWIAAEAAARAAPDGHTLLIVSQGTIAIDPHVKKSLPLDTLREYAFIAVVVDETTGMAVAVHPALPVGSLLELVEHARSRPGKLSYSTTITYGTMFGEWFRRTTGADMVEVRYKLASQAIQDAISGRVQVALQSPTSLSVQARAGKLRFLAFATAARIREFPDVPTVAETFANFSMKGFMLLVGPAGIAREIVERLNREVAGALKDPKVVAALDRIWWFNLEGPRTPEGTLAFVRRERETWGKFVRSIGMQPE